MAKKLIKRLLILLIILIIGHSIYWFLKTGKIEKSINNATLSNPSISVGSFNISGYPFKQIVTIKDLKLKTSNSLIGEKDILIKKIEAKADLYSSKFIVNLASEIFLYTKDNIARKIEFSKKPEISLIYKDSIATSFSYQDDGFKIFDDEKNIIFQSESDNLKISSSKNDNGKLISKIDLAMKRIEGFEIINIYKNSFEGKLIDKIKTGEINLASNIASNYIGQRFNIDINNENQEIDTLDNLENDNIAFEGEIKDDIEQLSQEDQQEIEQLEKVTSSQSGTEMEDEDKSDNNRLPIKKNSIANIGKSKEAQKVILSKNEKPEEAKKIEIEQDFSQNSNENKEKSIIKDKFKNIKNDLLIAVTLTLAPTEEQNITVPINPAELSIIDVKYNQTVDINKIKIENSLYQISVNGKIDYLQDDVKPSGYASVKIDNISNFTDYIKGNLMAMANDNESELRSFDASSDLEVSKDSYIRFLKKMIININPITKEISKKNPISTNEIAVFDVRREKNLDVVINETPIREILGKF